MRLAIVLPSLAGGGLERVTVHLMQEWARQGVDLDLVVSRFQGPLCDIVPEQVRVFEVGRPHAFLFPCGLYRYLSQRRPTHILSAAKDINAMTLTLSMLARKSTCVMVCFHNHLSTELALAKGIRLHKLRAVVGLLRRVILRANGVIAVSRAVANDLAVHFPGLSEKLHVISNPVITPQVRNRLLEPLKNCPVPQGIPWLIYVGRFVPAKGVDILLQAFRHIADKSMVHLVLMGEGPLKDRLQSMIQDMGLASRVHMVGFQNNPLPWMREANVLVLPSRHEGLPTVLIEALACGTQIVATDCPGGSKEILNGTTYGQLLPVEDPIALAHALFRSLNGDFYVNPQKLRTRAEDFASEKAAKQYMDVLLGNI